VETLHTERGALGRALDLQIAGFVSDQAEELESLAREEAIVGERMRRLRDYLALFERLDEVLSRITELVQRRSELEVALERAEQLDSLTAQRVERLEEWFATYVEALEIPVFGSTPRAAIDRHDYEPIVNGQKFRRLSAGVRVLVNVAHLLAHHRSALDLGLPLPRLMMIDGLTKNIGTAEYDAARIEDVWTSLIRLSEELPADIQTIVAANDAPARVRPFVRVEFSENNRLIPTDDLRPSRRLPPS